jgi:FkbM family methyltransferase
MEFTVKTTLSPCFDQNFLEKNYLRNKTINYIKNDNCIGASIKDNNYWESWMFKYIQENYVENTNILDLGGNIGTTTLLMSEVLSDNCNIITFEPLYSDILLKNVLDNNLSNKVIIYPYGVGNEIKNLKIKPINLMDNVNFGAVSLKENANFGATSLLHNVEYETDTAEINIVPLDYFNFENVSLIKIDVEDMEIEVLEGCLNLIKRYKPAIIIETFQLEKLQTTIVFEELTKLGYEIDQIPEGRYDFLLKIKS